MNPASSRQHAILRLDRVLTEVRLGWSEAERSAPQVVSMALALRFPAPPAATATDALRDTVDYATLVSKLREICGRGEYRLLERLAEALYREARAAVPADVGLSITVAKDPRLPGVEGRASFALRDWPEETGTDG
jgi:FolB domain-containing protein